MNTNQAKMKVNHSEVQDLNSIEDLSTDKLSKTRGGNSFDKEMKKIGKAINNSDPYNIYGH